MAKVLIENYSFEIEKLRNSLSFDGKFSSQAPIVGPSSSRKHNEELLS